MNKPPFVELLGIKIHSLKVAELIDAIGEIAVQKRKCIFTHVNIHAMNIAAKNSVFKNFLNNADINFCDGDGVRLGAVLQNKHIVEKITYNRFIYKLAAYSQDNNLSWYILGSKPGVTEIAEEKLNLQFPTLNIAGHHHGYINEEKVKAQVIEDIHRCQPNILILGMGMPYQERFLEENMEALSFNVALTGGAVFEYVSGKARMTPSIYYKLKLEWFYRFMHEPKRLFNRYVIGNPAFIIRVLVDKILKT